MTDTNQCGCGRHTLHPDVTVTNIGGVRHRRGEPCYMIGTGIHYDADGTLVRHVTLGDEVTP